MAVAKLWSTVKYFGALFRAIDINMPNRFLSYHCEFSETNPSPVDRNIWYLALFELLASLNVEDLDNCLVASASPYGNYVAFFVHQDAISLHIPAVNFEVLGGVDDCDLLKV